jgi:flagellar biogenesis protein FliO
VIDWLKEVAGPNFAPAVLWTALGLVILVLLLLIFRIVRSMTFGTFVAGGRNRKTRLAVMDAAPVDSQRRLVLVRRDDVEHLILIGGPTDVVVERDIRLLGAARRPAGGEQGEAQPRPRPAEAPGQSRPDRSAQPRAPQAGQGVPPAPARGAAPHAAPARMPPVQQVAPAPPRAAPPAVANASTGNSSATNTASANSPGTRPALAPTNLPPPTPRLKPVESSAPASETSYKARPRQEISLEDEMNRLLGELSSKK